MKCPSPAHVLRLGPELLVLFLEMNQSTSGNWLEKAVTGRCVSHSSSLLPTCQDISCFALQRASSTNLYLTTAQAQQNRGTLDSIKSLKVWPKETRSPFKLFPQTPTSDIKFTNIVHQEDNVLISAVCLTMQIDDRKVKIRMTDKSISAFPQVILYYHLILPRSISLNI